MRGSRIDRSHRLLGRENLRDGLVHGDQRRHVRVVNGGRHLFVVAIRLRPSQERQRLGDVRAIDAPLRAAAIAISIAAKAFSFAPISVEERRRR